MITISKIDFKNKTIDNVECSYGNVKDIKLSMVRNTFCVNVVYNDGESISTEVKKPKEDTIDNIIEVDLNNTQEEQMNISCSIEEEPKEEEQQHEVPNEEPKEEEQQHEAPKEEVELKELKEEQGQDKEPKMTIEELKEILTEKIEKRNTALSYYRTIKQAVDYFETYEIYALLQNEQEIIYFIEDRYKTSLSSISSKLCGVLKCYTVLNVESKLLKGRIQHFKTLLKVKQEADKEKVMDKKTIEEGEEILEHCKNEMDKLGEKIKNDIQLLNTWDITVQMYCVLKTYLDIGNLRGDEVVDMKILDTEDKINYINVKTNQIIIKNHKTEKSQGTRTIDIEDKKLLNILKKDWVNI